MSGSEESEHLSSSTNNNTTNENATASTSLSSSSDYNTTSSPSINNNSHTDNSSTANMNSSIIHESTTSSSTLPAISKPSAAIPHHYKAPPPSSTSGIASRPSSLSSRGSNRSSSANNKPHHAYFASSEEESEAELDEKDSHCSSRASNHHHHNYEHHHPQHNDVPSHLGVGIRGGPSKSSLRGSSKKLAEIATRSFHSSRVRMTIPQNDHHVDSSETETVQRKTSCGSSSLGGGSVNGGDNNDNNNNNKPIASIYKTTSSSSSHGALPVPEVTVAKSSNVESKSPSIPGSILHNNPSSLKRGSSGEQHAVASLPSTGGGGATGSSTANTTSPANTSSSNNNNHGNDTEDDEDNTSLIRLSLWSVIDGHGGGCVATYAAEVLLPHIAASVARALKSEIVDRGVCNVNGQLRDANALDLDGLIRSSDRSRHLGKSQARQREAGIDVVNPNSIHYRSPYEDSESEGDVGVDHLRRNIDDEEETTSNDHHLHRADGMRSESESEAESEAPVSVASSLLPGNPITSHGGSVSSVKTSVKTALSPVTQHAPVGTHSPAEVASITRAITDSFLAVDEGWINSIDPVTTHQTSCVSNGRWNAGACALVVFIVQRLDWCRSSRVDLETHHPERGAGGFEDTSHNKDAARRRKLDYASKSKSISSLSTLSSTSSITTEANATKNDMEIGEESEITETEDDDDVSDIFGPSRRRRKKSHHHSHLEDPHHQDGVFIPTPAGCKCHYYRPHDAMLYTAHVGDCRAVMLGSAPPRTIKVPPEQGDSRLSLDHSEDESSSESIADEISSSEHDDSDSSGDMMEDDPLHSTVGGGAGRGRAMGYVRRSKRQRRTENMAIEQPFVPLPPLRRESDSEESAIASDDSVSTTAQKDIEMLLETEDEGTLRSVRSGSPTQMNRPPSPTQLVADPVHPPPLPLSMLMRPIDLTTDHSAYNPAEVTAVLRRCNNAPKAISSASSGGIKRVAGSLAVTRALGDAYLKTPRLSFFPYKRHAPYITGRPEVNCRVLTKGADRIVTLASDGVWERASGDDVLRWVRNYYNARIAGVNDQHLHSYNATQQQHDHDVYGDNENSMPRSRKRRLAFANNEDVLGSTSDGSITVAAEASEEISSEEDVGSEKPASLTTSPSVDSTTKKSPEPSYVAKGTAAHSVDEKVVDSDTATTATTTTADETMTRTTATAKVGSKRKHTDSSTADDSVSSRSTSTVSFGHGALGTTVASSRRHLRSSSRSPYSLSIPTVSEVIVRKVLNKVRKTRNISSLRMLMSLPKGRARRSKHDDITATVVDLSVSIYLFFSLR